MPNPQPVKGTSLDVYIGTSDGRLPVKKYDLIYAEHDPAATYFRSCGGKGQHVSKLNNRNVIRHVACIRNVQRKVGTHLLLLLMMKRIDAGSELHD